MDVEKDELYVAQSQIPYTGKGLFTRKDIEKGKLIIEYTGEITTWDDVKHDADNAYIYFVNEDHVINAKNHPEAIARYANDARGLTRVKGLSNNSRFVNKDGKVFIKSTKHIPADSEILVSYGKDYWATVKKNKELQKATASDHNRK
jgi:SET domain-containing protein